MEEIPTPLDNRGGAFLLTEDAPPRMFTPEQLGPEARMLADAAADFMRGEVLPAADRLQEQEPGLMRSLLKHAGELGLMGLEIPEAYGGLGLEKSVTARIAEAVAVEPSFAVSHNVHTSVATLPILFFGTLEQKHRLLPMLAAGEWIGAYALSEAHAGSDAMAARTRAVPAADGYVLSGEKMWITNAAFADLFVVFARVEGQDGLSAFVVERDRPGLSVGREEHKLGLKGSSTCRVVLDGVPVPAMNLIGEAGQGGKIALNTLNLGRFKIAASSVGRAKDLLGIAARYAAERRAFGRPIAEFGLVSRKLSLMAARLFAAESMLYRLAGDLDRAFAGIDMTREDSAARCLAAAEELAAECAMLKVFCTETLDYCADECLQIHGGYGYTEEYPAARAWRDARVNRIYEGTNEINRANVAQILARRVRTGRLELSASEAKEAHALHQLMRSEEAGGAPQEAQGALADMMTERYARQSMAARTAGMPASLRERAEAAAACYLFKSGARRWAAERLFWDALGEQGKGAKASKSEISPDRASNSVTIGRELAVLVTTGGGYPF